jgi:hypothetical protein
MIFVTYESHISCATLFNFKNKPTQFTIKRDKREKQGKKERKRSQRHIETLMMTPPIPLKRYRWEEFNDTKEGMVTRMSHMNHPNMLGFICRQVD